LNFDGETFVAEFDAERLSGQLRRVYECTKDGEWRTLSELQFRISQSYPFRDSESSISARLRDLRKDRFGSFNMERRRRGEANRGTFEYRVIERGARTVD
jgi:hypothetical protein